MMKIKNSILLAPFVCLLLFINGFAFRAQSQEETSDKFVERFFMPAFQMGYIHHNSTQISGGLIIQTSLEYRTKRNLLIRLNYDDFAGRVQIKSNNNPSFKGRIPISELIGGFGYRYTKAKSNFFILVQSGCRFYENPIIENENGILSIEQQASRIATARYTLGYEYEVIEKVFLNAEFFSGHFYTNKDFWSNKKPHFGFTLGVSARLF